MDKEPVCPACKTPLQLIYRRSRSQNGKTYKPKNASCFRMLICPACSPRRENTQNVHYKFTRQGNLPVGIVTS